MQGVSLTHPVLALFCFYLGSFLIHHVLASFLSGEFLLHIPYCFFFFFFFLLLLLGGFPLHIPCWLHMYLGSFSYTSHVGFIFIWGVSLTHPVLASFLSREILLHIQCGLHFYLGSFSYTSTAGFIFMWGISLTHPMLALFFCGGCFSYTSRAGFFF